MARNVCGRARKSSKKERDKIDVMTRSELGDYILKAPHHTGAFSYAVCKFVKRK